MQESGGLTRDRANAFLDIALSEQKNQMGVATVPTVLINGVKSQASTMSVASVFRAICDAYSSDQPEACKLCSQSKDPVACVTNGGASCNPDAEILDWLYNHAAPLVLLVLLVIGIGFGACCRCRRKEDSLSLYEPLLQIFISRDEQEDRKSVV